MSSVIGIIGGSGFYVLDEESAVEELAVHTPFDDSPVAVYRQQVAGKQVLFLPRHGKTHGVPPHRINYRANMLALKESGAERIIAVNVVGGISDGMEPGILVVPDQLIDYTWGRAHTYFDTLESAENHIDFSWPYDAGLRAVLIQGAADLGYPCREQGVYGCTQGPRLETAAEIMKLKRDACDIVGMTAMPEAALARELALPYASIALVVNRAAGLTGEAIAFGDIAATLETGIAGIRRLLITAIVSLE